MTKAILVRLIDGIAVSEEQFKSQKGKKTTLYTDDSKINQTVSSETTIEGVKYNANSGIAKILLKLVEVMIQLRDK